MLAATSPSGTSAAAIWGDLFEVAVKRGCLAYLAHAGLLPPGAVGAWGKVRMEQLHVYLHDHLDIVDPAERSRHSSTLDHLLLQGWGLGWTSMREALKVLQGESLRTEGLLCPLHLPGRRTPGQAPVGAAQMVQELWEALRLEGRPDAGWAGKGEPANADFLLWLHDGLRHHVIVLEFSVNTLAAASDFGQSLPHLMELLAHARRLDSRGVFTRIGASLTSEQFVFSEQIVSHLSAFTTRDKPLYKLCQASSYATRLIDLMAQRGTPLGPATAHAIAVTNTGVEALRAAAESRHHPRWKLMASLGAAYRGAEKPVEESPGALNDEIRIVRTQIVQALPPVFRGSVAAALEDSDPEQGLDLHLSEVVEGVLNPAARVLCTPLLDGVDESEAVVDLLGHAQPRAHLGTVATRDGTTTLRDLHAAAIREAIAAAQTGRITVIAAEGSPGIGKTTAVMNALQALPDGFLWLYASPRLVINGEVTQKMARSDDGAPSGVLTLTTNAKIISGAKEWWQKEHPGDGRKVDAAVVVDGVPAVRDVPGSTTLVTPQQGAEIEARYSGNQMQKTTVDEDTDRLDRERLKGVLETLARTTRSVLKERPDLHRVVITASIQGFRTLLHADARKSARDTVERLSKLFGTNASDQGGTGERQRFAQHIPTIVVMVDEIAGDGAGAPFVHALARWLHQEFIDPFDGPGGSPFRVVFVLADASLANATVLKTYLEERDAPEKVLVSPSQGALPFRVTAGTLRLHAFSLPALHVMADGFPAGRLRVDYQAHLTRVHRDPSVDAQGVSARKAILNQESEHILRRAVESVFAALCDLPGGQQVIFFAQDKLLLRAVRGGLLAPEGLADEHLGTVETHGARLRPDDIAILDASVPPKERMDLLQPACRDRKRVFLMTSSGARGVSFPLVTTIIALVPTFSIEGGFMEIAQLVYRGRGRTADPVTGAEIDGDAFDRRLVLVLQDFLLADEEVDDRQWLRRTVDVLAGLVLLRATLLTRMIGDAGIPGQRAAVVPIGRVGTEDVSAGLSEAVRVFLRECEVYLHGHPGADQGLVRNAQEGVLRFFESFRRAGRLPAGQSSITQEHVLRDLVAHLTARLSPIFDPTDCPALPEHVYGLGPVWLESWAHIPSEEGFHVRAQTKADQASLNLLRKQLWQIGGSWSTFPLQLTWAARDLVKILERVESLRARSFTAERLSEATKRWVCVPLDYTTFCFVEGEHGRELRVPHADEHQLWRDGLLRIVSANAAPTTIEPVIPLYAGVPFVVITTSGDPTGMARVFDDRYFMASTELNLLNTVLFVDRGTAP